MKKLLAVTVLTAALFLGVASVASANGGYGGGYCHDRCHVVYYGETLFSIGRHYDVNPYHIAEANGLYDPNHIYAGQVLYIPSGSRYPWHAHNNCGYGYDCGKSYHQPAKCGSGCGYGHDNKYNQGYGYGHGYDKCGSDCGKYDSGYHGYDYTGYYYGNYHKDYSHTCGYYSNCW